MHNISAMDSINAPGFLSVARNPDKGSVSTKIEDYLTVYEQQKPDEERREEFHAKGDGGKVMTNHYYDLVTDFYEYGWGDSFHFSTQDKGESREHSFAKHEYRLALKLGIQKGETALDVGCGIGGPARSIAAFSECNVIGLNCNEYQIKRAEFRTKKIGLQDQCSFVKGDFNCIPFPSESFKRVYAVEATCHAVNLEQVYSQVFRVLKPGGVFANYEWIVTDKFNPNDPHHLKIKDDILMGNFIRFSRSIYREKLKCNDANTS